MSAASGKGTGMHLDSTFVRFGRSGPGRPAKLGDSVADIRRLLRTEMTIGEIAKCFGVTAVTLRNFIKRRQLCNLTERRNFRTLQRTLEKLDKGKTWPA